jgi:hypothetical protein
MQYDMFICIGVSSLVDRTAHTDACKTYHTVHTTAFLRMKPRVSKHAGDNKN